MSWRRLQDKKFHERLKARARIIQLVREFFISEGFLEIDSPNIVPSAGQEPYLNPVKTELWDEQGKKVQGYFITSPEYAHKKLLAAGFEKTFEITKCVRAGEDWGGTHNPEFTMIEWYRAHVDYTKLMEDTERMVQFVAQRCHFERSESEGKNLVKESTGSFAGAQDDRKIHYQGRTIELSSPWERLTMAEAFQTYAHVANDSAICDRTYLSGLCKERGHRVTDEDSYDDLFFKIFLTEVEPKLGKTRPTILYEFPAQMASLARIKESDPRYAERFEVYIGGMELGNAFSELNDGKEQRKRFLEEQALRRKLGKESIPFDEDFLDAAGNMPAAAGIAFGIDRLVMLLTDATSIEEVLAFPARELWGLQKIE